MKMLRLLMLLGLAAFGFHAPSAHALKGDADQPVNVRAKSVEANEKTGISTYRGQVVMTQGSLRIDADRVDVTTREGRLQRAQAHGRPAKVRTRLDTGELLEAHANRIDYQAGAREIGLAGNAWVKRGADEFRGATAHYGLDTQVFTAEGAGEQPVTAVIQPAQKEDSR